MKSKCRINLRWILAVTLALAQLWLAETNSYVQIYRALGGGWE